MGYLLFSLVFFSQFCSVLLFSFLSVTFFAEKYFIGKSMLVGMPLSKGVSLALETKLQGCPKNAGPKNSSQCCSCMKIITCMKRVERVHSQFGMQ